MPVLPPADDEPAWLQAHALPVTAYLPALARLEPAPSALPWERLPGGEDSVVVARGSTVVKLVPPLNRRDADQERSVLPRLRLSVPTPRLDHVQSLDGWTALRMSRLVGHPAQTSFATLPPAAQRAVLRTLGETLVEIGRTPIAPEDGDAGATLAALRARALRHEDAGFPDVAGFLARHLPAEEPPAFVHFDLNDGNVMLADGQVSGVLDFVASRAFFAPLDLVTPAVFFARGDRALLGALLEAAGAGGRSAEELVAWHLLHPFSAIGRDLALAGRSPGTDPRAALVALWSR